MLIENNLKLTDIDLIDYWYWIRWDSPSSPKMTCPFCNDSNIRPLVFNKIHKGRKHHRVSCVWKCYRCLKQFSDTSQTIFRGSKLDVRLWIKAIYLCEKYNFSIHNLKDILGVSYVTACRMKKRIKSIIKEGKINLNIPVLSNQTQL